MSPALFSYLQSQEVPSSSAPPSLDGSLSSDQLAAMSVPPTPEIGSVNGDDEDQWGNGVQLQPDAMATLQALSGDQSYEQHHPEQVIELEQAPRRQAAPVREMQQTLPPLTTNIHRNNSVTLSPEAQRSLASLTKLEIPSPGGFFSTLSHSARHTWHLVPCTPESAAPPSSTTAEHFYKTPWSSNAPVERILEVSETSDCMSEGLPTARPYFPQQKSDETIKAAAPVVEEEIVADEMISEPLKLENIPVENIDRTGMWLAAQSSYLSELINPTEERDDEAALLQRNASIRTQREEVVEVVDETPSPPRKTRTIVRSKASSLAPVTVTRSRTASRDSRLCRLSVSFFQLPTEPSSSGSTN
jgi:hypothetical protein